MLTKRTRNCGKNTLNMISKISYRKLKGFWLKMINEVMVKTGFPQKCYNELRWNWNDSTAHSFPIHHPELVVGEDISPKYDPLYTPTVPKETMGIKQTMK